MGGVFIPIVSTTSATATKMFAKGVKGVNCAPISRIELGPTNSGELCSVYSGAE